MVQTTALVDARTRRITWPDVRRSLRNVDDINVAKGQERIHIELGAGKQRSEVLTHLLLRPRGNLRTPAFRRGRTLVVGFDEATYRRILSGA